MQCPDTPPHDVSNAYPTPELLLFESGTARKRTPQQHSSKRVKHHQGAENHELSQISTSRPRATTFQKQNNVFQTPEAGLQKRNVAVPVVQFHDAQKRLPLSILPANPRAKEASHHLSKLSSRKKFPPTPKALDFSRKAPWLSPEETPLGHKIYQEQDIASAWKESVFARSKLDESRESPLPVRRNRPPVKRTLQFTHWPAQTRNQTNHRVRNFSRPIDRVRPFPLDASKAYPPVCLSTSPASTDITAVQIHAPGIASVLPRTPIVPTTKSVGEHKSTQQGNIDDVLPSTAAYPQGRILKPEDQARASFDSAVEEELGDRRLQLKSWEIWLQRILFTFFVFAINIALGLAYLGSKKHPYHLAILVFMKSRDILSTLANVLSLMYRFVHDRIWKPKDPKPRSILSLVCAYAETEEQIMKTVSSLASGRIRPHSQTICIVLDGKPRDVLSKMSDVKVSSQRPYTTWRGARGEIKVHGGLLNGTPMILVEKIKNAGKKDSLILGHDLFNHPREDMPKATRLLRQEIWTKVLPALTRELRQLTSFDYIFCTDADSTIHENALRRLADALCCEVNAIAACGVLFAELGDSWIELSPWHLFQQFQYTFGQYVRRQAESTWGRVTCLPGCITMIAVRPEMGVAISEYARPVTEHNLFRHQVQYLGTDRRLTWSMLSQNKHLRTIFVPDALSETVVPNSLSHYLSQRRRWASNAYFNDFFYVLGPRQRFLTRLFAAIDLVRLTLVFYRVFNTVYFLHGLITNFYVIKIIPTLVVTKTPTLWYLLLIIAKEPVLRKRLHKIVLGLLINQVISPFLSVLVFINVLLHVGSQSWGKTGVSTQGPSVPINTSTSPEQKPTATWTPRSLAKTVRTAIKGITPKAKAKDFPPCKVPKPLVKDTEAQRGETSVETPHVKPTQQYDIAGSISGDRESTLPHTTVISPETTQQTPCKVSSISSSTPFSLLRRTPHRRKPAMSKLRFDTPTQGSQVDMCFDFGFKEK